MVVLVEENQDNFFFHGKWKTSEPSPVLFPFNLEPNNPPIPNNPNPPTPTFKRFLNLSCFGATIPFNFLFLSYKVSKFFVIRFSLKL